MTLLHEISGGWRRFAVWPERVSWMRVRRHFDAMPSAAFVDLACDRMNEAALIFTYRSHRFGIDLDNGSYRFNVEDPACPEDILREVLGYAGQLMGSAPD